VALIQGIRRELDGLLEAKVARPDTDISRSPVLNVVIKLLTNDGL
jgi:hypothetical protein